MKTLSTSDVTFIIPVRIDSAARLENLNLVVDYLCTYFGECIIVLEADINEKVHSPKITNKIFEFDPDPVFHRTRYINQMAGSVLSHCIAVWDCDVMVDALQIAEGIELIKIGAADMVFPFDGRFYDTPAFMKDVYKESGNNFEVFNLNRGSFHLMHGYYSVGGAFLVNRRAYLKAGFENENFYGWGPEDAERVKRWEILGYSIARVSGAMYHLFHPRLQNSWFASGKAELQNRNEFIKVCRMAQTELKDYVKSWSWYPEIDVKPL
jgi:hypothetical protein